jgi:Rod binding domain-containing protein
MTADVTLSKGLPMDISLKTTTGYRAYTGTGMQSGAIRSASQESKIKSACMEMESMFIQNMFKEMRASIPKGGLTSGGKAEEMFTEMLDAELARNLSASGGIGLSSMVQRQLETVPEIGKNNPAQ